MNFFKIILAMLVSGGFFIFSYVVYIGTLFYFQNNKSISDWANAHFFVPVFFIALVSFLVFIALCLKITQDKKPETTQ